MARRAAREPTFSDTLELDLATVEPSLAGPSRPQDRVALSQRQGGFLQALRDYVPSDGDQADARTRRRRVLPADPPSGGDRARAADGRLEPQLPTGDRRWRCAQRHRDERDVTANVRARPRRTS